MSEIQNINDDFTIIFDQEFYTPKDLARILKVSVNYLNKLRMDGKGPRFFKPTEQVVRYYPFDLNKFMKEKTYRSTSEYPPKKSPPQSSNRRKPGRPKKIPLALDTSQQPISQ